jgi:hypothetical protein
MLAHSPPLPLIINHFSPNSDTTAEDEEGIILALQQRDHVHHIHIRRSAPILQKLIDALDGEFPILEYLYAIPQLSVWRTVEPSTSLNLPETFRASHLRHLLLRDFALPIESPVLTTVGSLVTLSLNLIPPSAYFHPNTLLRRLSLMPQLELLGITFASYYPSRDVERQLLRTPIMTHVTLPNLRWLGFQGSSAYLEALLPWVTIPLLEKLQVYFFNQLTYSIPHLQQFMSTAGNLRLKTATLTFHKNHFELMMYPHEGARMYTLAMFLGGRHLDWQVASAAQVFFTLGTVLSTVEHLTLEYGRYHISSEWNNEADRTQWRELFGSFGNVKILHLRALHMKTPHVEDHELVKQLSRALQPGAEGESPTELLPDLQELSYFASGALHNAFSLFIDARQKAGRPVNVVHSRY